MRPAELLIHRTDYRDRVYPASKPATQAHGIPFLLIRLAVFAIAPFILVDAALYQFEMLMTGGRTPITPALLKLGLLGALGAACLLRGKIKQTPALRIALLFTVYLVVAALHQHFDLDIDPVDILLSYNAYYLLPLLGVVALTVPVAISDRTLTLTLLVLALLCGGLGIAQYLTNSPIVPTYSTDGYFNVLVWSNFGHIRVFSLFVEPAACAVFFCLIACLAIALSARTINLPITIPLLALSLFISWASGARTNIIGTVCSVVTSYIFTFRRGKGRTRWLPIIWLAVGIVVAVYAYAQTLNGSLLTGLITDTSSFAERFKIWTSILDMFRSTSPLNLLFGYGLVQNPRVDPDLGGSDNLYLATILHIGLIGLCLMLMLLWNLWETVRREAEITTSPVTIAVAATYSTLFLTALFKLGSFGMIFLIFAISHKASPRYPIRLRSGLEVGPDKAPWNSETALIQ